MTGTFLEADQAEIFVKSQGTIASVAAPEKTSQTVRKTVPNYRVIVLDDDFNTFEHVAECLLKYIPGMTGDRAWELTNQVHFDGQATVWTGQLEQAELYHMQLGMEGLTMAPLEAG
ncbi:MAG: ATP-dependent Clp protease adapter ClpS [Leptolyngbyaceae cyanobacterium CSU_1_3]|nr:ATP-dependent Clp protease adapter ClpS [Leptolyngbyaceae cyanobacterium CSU_1_3]